MDPRPSVGNKHQVHSTVQCGVYADLCSLLAVTSRFSILIGQKMQLTGCHNDNEMRNAIYAWTPKFQLSGPTVHSYLLPRVDLKTGFFWRVETVYVLVG